MLFAILGALLLGPAVGLDYPAPRKACIVPCGGCCGNTCSLTAYTGPPGYGITITRHIAVTETVTATVPSSPGGLQRLRLCA